ncbi:MAG: hypothetical protein GY903_08820 [Fuerstiella sp.]|nr:hypothetical protein [Fuerstiella sp.]MCP4854583.1 hypothetical protein [Fuerstiella sp.]
MSVAGVEGSPITVARDFSDVGQWDSHTATINWGDGNTTPGTVGGTAGGSGTVTGSHVYSDSGDYTVTITLIDDELIIASDTIIATIANVAPTLSNVAVTFRIDENDFATLSGDLSDPGTLDTFTLMVDWGEGTPVSYPVAAGATSFSVSHQYLDDDPTATQSDTYIVTGTLTDDDGGSAVLSNTADDSITFDDLTERKTFYVQGISSTYHGFEWGHSRSSDLASPVIPSTSVYWDWASATVNDAAYMPGPTPVSGDSYAWNSGGPQSLFIDFLSPTAVVSANFATLSSKYSSNASTIQMFGYDASNNQVGESSSLNLTNDFQQLNAGFTNVRTLEIRANDAAKWFSIDDLILNSRLTVTVDGVAPTLSGLSATSILENGTTTLSGTIADVGYAGHLHSRDRLEQ